MKRFDSVRYDASGEGSMTYSGWKSPIPSIPTLPQEKHVYRNIMGRSSVYAVDGSGAGPTSKMDDIIQS